MKRSKYTVFCVEHDQRGTTYITSVEAWSIDEAKDMAHKECADQWTMPVDCIHVLGVLAGDVTVLEWEDIL